MTVNGTGSGSVTSSPAGIHCPGTCSYDFTAGTTVTLTATAATGSSFAGWYSTGWPPPCMGTTAPCKVTMNQADSIRATFNVVMESVDVLNGPQPGASGTITVSGPGTQLTVGPGQARQAFFKYGAVVTLTPTPASSSAFIGWTGDCSGYGACVIAATRSLSIQGSFAVGQKLQVRLTGRGAGTVTSIPAAISCPGTCAGLFGVDSEVTLTATPAPGSYFAGWPLSSGCDDSESTCTFQMANSDDLDVADFRLDHCLVPNVTRLALAKARSRLVAYSCRAGTIARAYSKHVKKGAVISQKPKAGRQLARGAKVHLVLSRGKRH
ncbi:MAG: InlB B-repeat-containing protein [Gaiellaceae bacterium]